MVKEEIYKILERVADPEIPVLTVLDLGIIRDVVENPEGIEILITPTYSGCPAMLAIATSLKMELAAEGYNNVAVREILEPAWTTDWMSESGKEKLKAYGIAPPVGRARIDKMLFETPPQVACPRCGSKQTERISEFGSTACKSLYRCQDCLEPFDYFKCH